MASKQKTDTGRAGLDNAKNHLLEVDRLTKHFPVKGGLFNSTIGQVKAVNQVSFNIRKGEVLGVVGESGCGKSTVGLTVLQLIPPTSGSVKLNGRELTSMGNDQLRMARKQMQIIFQDPMASLNPRKTILHTIGEPLDIISWKTPPERLDRVIEIAGEVGIPAEHLNRLPHEFSGGQRQRICIARALVMQPEFVVADEAVSALDVSIQAQVIRLLERLQDKYRLSYMFISHDMRVIKHICDRVAVMYLGNMVEVADKAELFKNPVHPYTRALLSSVPRIRQGHGVEKIILSGDVPSPINAPSGCAFHPRCPSAKPICSEQTPEIKQVDNGSQVACHLM
jgi:oligopeptide transport system ATP-binding protein